MTPLLLFLRGWHWEFSLVATEIHHLSGTLPMAPCNATCPSLSFPAGEKSWKSLCWIQVCSGGFCEQTCGLVDTLVFIVTWKGVIA
jgi:hypothetical protein